MADYKFIEGSIPYTTTSSLGFAFKELKECLKSEQVDLGLDDIIRAYDVFLRIVGIGKGYNTQNPDDFCDIFSLCGIVKCTDVASKIANGSIDIKVYESIFDSINAIVEDDCKFKDIDTVKASIIVLFKEFTTFTNDLFDYMKEFYDKNSFDVINSTYIIYSSYNKSINFFISYNAEIKTVAIAIMSNVLSSDKANKISIIVDSFDSKTRELLLEKEKESKQ